MPHRVYSEINLHITWHTQNNLPMINQRIERDLHDFVQTRILETPETFFHAIGGIENHIHIVVSTPSNLEIANWIGVLKGSCSYYINNAVVKKKVLQWQSGYGVVSFGTKDLESFKAYVLNQKQHHKIGKVYKRLERIEI